ncbi:MAG: cbb3-type cytochrome oxidase assembly protein CcoS [Saprospiraceae bacterium]
MEVLFILILASLCIAVCFLLAFIWSIYSNQFDDVYSPGERILFDDKQVDNSK